MPEQLIKHVADNMEKRDTYRYQLGRYKKALRDGFYFEAMMIVYAMLEDRLKALLYYSGAFNDRNVVKLSKKTKDELMHLYRLEYGEKSKISLINISGKIKLLRAILNWVEFSNEDIRSDYLRSLKQLFEGVDIGALKECFDNLDEWLKYRNEVMHAAMNKNLGSLYDSIDIKVEAGMEYARLLDSFARNMKKDNRVRKLLKMGNK